MASKDSSASDEHQKEKEFLYAQIGQQKVEIEFLKKMEAIAGLKEKRKMIDSGDKNLSINKQCELMEIHRSGLYSRRWLSLKRL